VRLAAGVYDLFVDDPSKEIAIEINRANDFTFAGEPAANGEPATTLLRHYKLRLGINGKQTLRAANCKNINIKNLTFDDNPRYMTAGKIISNDGETLTIEIFEGNPVLEDGLLYCCNLWDLKTKTLLKVPSQSYGADVDARPEEFRTKLSGLSANGLKLVNVKNAKIASIAKVGDGISWHFGFNGNVFNVTMSEDIYVENINMHAAIGFCGSISRSKNIYVKNYRLYPAGNQLAVGSRDGLMLGCDTGKVVMENLRLEGVRWDGQNAHGLFIWLKEKLDARTAIFTGGGRMDGRASMEIRPDTEIGFYMFDDEEVRVKMIKAEIISADSVQKYYKITFAEDIPDFVKPDTLTCTYSWDMGDYTVKNSSFKNIAGCANLVRNSNILIENCTYEYIMYPAIMLGPSIGEQEGFVSSKITIKNSRFNSCGWAKRHDALGAIAAKSALYKKCPTDPVLQNIAIENNVFENCDIAMQLENLRNLKIMGNKFINVQTPLLDKNLSNVKSDL